MAKQIKGTDIIEKDHLGEAAESAKEYLEVVREIDKTLKRTAKDAQKMAKSANLGKAEDIKKLDAALKQSNQTKKAAVEIDKKQSQVQKQLAAATDAEVKGKIRLQNATKQQKAELRDLLILENKEAGTLQKLQARNRQLRREREQLNLSTADGRKKLQAINRQLDLNNTKIKRNSDALKRQKINVGNYGAAVSRVTTLMKGFGATLIASFGIRQIGSFFKNSIEGFRTQEKAVAKVEQAIKSTGGAANKTSKELQDMASELQKNSLFGDEQILNEVTAQLLTFTNIGNENFDRTQQVALDLATVLDGDLKSASIQLGKALNDPVANLSALSRSGIQFSAEQKATIKSLAETNRLADAQAVILSELERQYGGQAKAAADADGGIQQLKNTFGDLQELIGKRLVKAIKPLAEDLRNFIENIDPKDIDAFAGGVVNAIKQFAAWAVEIAKVVKLLRQEEGSAAGLLEILIRIQKLGNPFKFMLKPLDFILEKLGLADDLTRAWKDALDTLGLRDWAADLGLVEKALDNHTEAQKRSNTVRQKSIEVTDRILEQYEDEIGDIPMMIDALQAENTTREDKQAIIEKLNQDYPEVIKNINLETASTEQLTQVKKDLMRTLFEQAIAEQKAQAISTITNEIMDRQIRKIRTRTQAGKDFLQAEIDEWKRGFKVVEEIDKELRANLGDFIEGMDFSSPIEENDKAITDLKNQIRELEKELQGLDPVDDAERIGQITTKLTKLKEELFRIGGTYQSLVDDSIDREKQATNESLNNSKKSEKEKTDNLKKEWEKRQDINKLNFGELLKLEQEFIKESPFSGGDSILTSAITQATLDQVEQRKKRLEQLKKFRDESLEIFKEITKGLEQEIDKRIQARQSEIQDADQNISRLQGLAAKGNTDAAEAIKAERARVAKEKLEIEALEKRKRNLLIVVTALEKANQNIGKGDTNAFKNASSSVKEFLSTLPTFSEGTIGTVAQALGHTGTKDGHIVRVDDNEHILSINDSKRLHAAGLNTNSAIVGAALSAQSNAISSFKAKPIMTDQNIVSAVKENTRAVKDIDLPTSVYDQETGQEIIRYKNKTVRINHKPKWKI